MLLTSGVHCKKEGGGCSEGFPVVDTKRFPSMFNTDQQETNPLKAY